MKNINIKQFNSKPYKGTQFNTQGSSKSYKVKKVRTFTNVKLDIRKELELKVVQAYTTENYFGKVICTIDYVNSEGRAFLKGFHECEVISYPHRGSNPYTLYSSLSPEPVEITVKDKDGKVFNVFQAAFAPVGVSSEEIELEIIKREIYGKTSL